MNEATVEVLESPGAAEYRRQQERLAATSRFGEGDAVRFRNRPSYKLTYTFKCANPSGTVQLYFPSGSILSGVDPCELVKVDNEH